MSFAESSRFARNAANLSKGIAIASIGVAALDLYRSDRRTLDYARATAEASVGAVSGFGGVAGLAIGVGWELGRLVTQHPSYQYVRNDWWMPLRQRKFGY